MTDTLESGASGASGSSFPLSATRARVCEDYPEVAPLCATSATRCELTHDWQAKHPRKPRGSVNLSREGSQDRVGPEQAASAIHNMGAANA